MGVASYKHDIKTIFLVINTTVALTIGLLPLSLGVGTILSETPEPELTLIAVVVGTSLIALASLGHYAAIVEKRTVLRIYAAVMGLVTFAEVIVLTKFTSFNGIDSLAFGIYNTAITLLATTLAMVLAKQIRRKFPVVPALAATPTAPTTL